MAKKTGGQRARNKQLSMNRQKRWGEPSSSSNTSPTSQQSPPQSPLPSNSLPDLADLSISDHCLSIPDPISSQDQTLSNANVLPPEPVEPNDPGVNPEDLPFEDPESVVGDLDDEIQQDDWWWERDDAEELGGILEPENEDCDIRVDNQPIPFSDRDELIKELDKIVKDSYQGHGKTQCSTRPSFDGNENDTARVVFRPGKERDGYFINEDVCEQTERSLKILTKEYSHEQHLLVFDNATTHTKFPVDTPVPSRMTWGPSLKVGGDTIGPSGEKIKVKFSPAKFADGSPQELYYPTNHQKKELRGAFKGLAKILEERGIPGIRKLKLQCPTTKGQDGCPRDRKDCCARTIMANQPDILAQKTILETLAESYGCSVLYLPKYHCELNPIKQVWGAAKRVYRENPMSSTEADLIRNALASLDSVKLESIRRFVARSIRFIHAYKDGLTGAQAAWANKQYHGHRVVTEAVLRLVD